MIPDTQSFRLNATGLSGSIATSALLGVMQGLYTETLKVQDEGGLQFVKVINITVNREFEFANKAFLQVSPTAIKNQPFITYNSH